VWCLGRLKSGVKRSSGASKIYCARRIAYHAPNKGLSYSPLVWPTESACSDSEGECDKRSRSLRRALPGEKREKRELLAMGIGLHDSSTVADTAQRSNQVKFFPFPTTSFADYLFKQPAFEHGKQKPPLFSTSSIFLSIE
jgi:hypothetical protein